jgi:hypothetical protein
MARHARLITLTSGVDAEQSSFSHSTPLFWPLLSFVARITNLPAVFFHKRPRPLAQVLPHKLTNPCASRITQQLTSPPVFTCPLITQIDHTNA